MSQIQTNKQQSTEGVPSIRNPREGYLGRMLLSVIISSILLFLLLLGFNTSLDAVMPSAIVWCYKLLNDIVSFLFVTSNQSGQTYTMKRRCSSLSFSCCLLGLALSTT